MLILVTLLIASTASHRVTESIEDLPPDAFNTTTLLPVSNKTANGSNSNKNTEATKIVGDATVWKIETAFGESKLDEKESNQADNVTNTTMSPQAYKTKNTSAEFRPSPHLSTYIEDDSLEIIPTRSTVGDFRPLKKPPSGFISFPKDNFKSSFHHSPKDIFKQNQFPYKFEPNIITKTKNSWRPTDALDSKPTMESPMRVPAGGLYKSPEAFKEKPGSDEDFGLNFEDLKDNQNLEVKNRVNPWKNLLRLVTAFIPVGLIISALTPSVITVQSTGPGPGNGYSPIYRRSDSELPQLSPISEPCRRRLLCELHSDTNYQQSSQSTRSRRRQCHRLRCEEPEALAKMLQWILKNRAIEQREEHFT